MQIDAQLLGWHGDHPDTLILRFYDWSPPAVSLGCHQVCPLRWQTIAEGLGWDIVRRPSGGRAVVHQGTLTYMLIGKQIYPKRRDMYAYFCEFLIKGFQQLGIELSYGAGKSSAHASCWHSHTPADLVNGWGTKLIGSAQLYRRGSVLQHGSVLIQPDLSKWRLFFPDAALPSTTSFENGDLLALQGQLIDTLTCAAIEHFSVEFEYCELSELLPCLL